MTNNLIQDLKDLLAKYETDELKVGDYVEVTLEGFQGRVGVIEQIDFGTNARITRVKGTGVTDFYTKDLKKITKEEYEQEKKLLEEGWIRHTGNECPVDDACDVEFRFNGEVEKGWSDNIVWCNSFITHYRIIEQKKENPYGLMQTATYGDKAYCLKIGRDECTHHKYFTNKEKRNVIQEALNTWLELLSCEGVEAKNGEFQYLIEALVDEVAIECIGTLEVKLDKISPAFNTRENAQKAIDKIGEDRLRSMFNILGGRFEE